MRPLLALAFCALALPAFAGSDIGVADFEVTEPADVAMTAAIDSAVDAATATIGTCREAGGELTACLCAHLEDLDRARAALQAALARHPDWTGKALFVKDIGDGRSLTIWLDTVARMVEPPECG